MGGGSTGDGACSAVPLALFRRCSPRASTTTIRSATMPRAGLGGFACKCYAPVWCFAHTLGTALRFARRPAPASVPPRKVGAAGSQACLKQGSGAQSRFQADPRRSNRMMFASFHATISYLVQLFTKSGESHDDRKHYTPRSAGHEHVRMCSTSVLVVLRYGLASCTSGWCESLRGYPV